MDKELKEELDKINEKLNNMSMRLDSHLNEDEDEGLIMKTALLIIMFFSFVVADIILDIKSWVCFEKVEVTFVNCFYWICLAFLIVYELRIALISLLSALSSNLTSRLYELFKTKWIKCFDKYAKILMACTPFACVVAVGFVGLVRKGSLIGEQTEDAAHASLCLFLTLAVNIIGEDYISKVQKEKRTWVYNYLILVLAVVSLVLTVLPPS